MESEYMNKLIQENRDVGERYRLKLGRINNVDPFTLDVEALDYSIDGVPPVTKMDIVCYLVLTHSYYTKEQMKAYKSLQAYKYFEAGFVEKAGTVKINDFYVLVGKVKHSLKGNAKALDVWCIICKDGSISTGHCTCMAGNSEVCSHVGAILYAAEYANIKKNAMSCIDVQAVWPMPSLSSQVPIVPLWEMNWGKAAAHEDKFIPPVMNTELVDALEKLSQLNESSAVMQIMEPFATKINEGIQNIIPSMFDIFSEENINKSYSELMEIAKKIVFFEFTMDQVSVIDDARINQADNPNWYIQRAGRITASKFKAVCKTKVNKPSLSLIKSICYPTKMRFATKATTWGMVHEKSAVEKYKEHMKDIHESLTVNEVGFIVSLHWPQLGAAPDRFADCNCCRGGCLEVKCPYSLYTNKVKDINEYVHMKIFDVLW